MADMFDVAQNPTQASAPPPAPPSSPAAAPQLSQPQDIFDRAQSAPTPTAPTAQTQDPSTTDLLSSTPEVEVAGQGLKGLKEAGQDVWSVVKNAVSHPLDTALATNPVTIGIPELEHIREAIPLFHAYETARSQGKSILDSLSAAESHAAQQSQTVQALNARVDEFKKNPTVAQVRLVGDAAAAALALYGGGEAAAAPEAEAIAPDVTEASEPHLLRQIISGREVEQVPAQAALRRGAEGVTTSQPASLRTLLEEPIDTFDAQAKAAYRQIDRAAGTDFKALNEKLSNTEFQIRQLTDTVEDSAKETDLMKARQGLIDKIAAAKQQAVENGVDPAVLDKADAMFKQARALEEVEAKVFKNPTIVRGNSAMGTPERVNVDAAVKALQRLQDSEKYGAPRLEQALGREQSQALLRDLYAAQRQGVKAITRQQWATRIAKLGLGSGIGYEILRGLTK